MQLTIDVEKRFGTFHCRLSCTVTSDSCGVFGPSGSGKSTLMNMLSGLVRPDLGTILLDGTTLFDSTTGVDLPPDQRRVGVVFQHAHLFPHLNVRRNLFYGMKRIPPEERTIDAQRLIATLRLEHLLDRRVTRLSGGERQRVALGRTILACPRLILLDEPLAGLDRDLAFEIIPQVRRVFAEFSMPMLFISHSLQEMRLMTDTVLVMNGGHLDGVVTTEELARSGRLSGRREYINLLELDSCRDHGDLLSYRWGSSTLIAVKHESSPRAGCFCLSARDILLFKRHPEASSARNILPCTVVGSQRTDWLERVELDCNGIPLIAEILPQSLTELAIAPGSNVIAVFKASALRPLS